MNITTTYTYLPPRPPPRGDSWEEEADYPGIELHITIQLEGEHVFATLMGESLTHWTDNGATRTFRNETLEASEADARAFEAEFRAEADVLTNARKARMARREAAIAKAHARHGAVKPPEPTPIGH